MRNICIVLNNRLRAFSQRGVSSIIEEFRSKGYLFDEVRFLFQEDETILRSYLTECKKTHDNILLLARKTQCMLCQNAISQDFVRESVQENSALNVYKKENGALFLLAIDEKNPALACVREICIPYLNRVYNIRRAQLVVRAVGANSLRVEQLISRAEALSAGKLSILHAREYDEDVVRVFYGEEVSKMLLDDVLRLLAEGLGDTVYALEDVTLEEQLVRLLQIRGKKISVAESFTGGGIARAITSVSGASAVYFEGLNTYHENSKIKRLGVLEYTLKTAGAVSDQTAYEMAAGLIASGDCDISIATTGLAGPNTDRSGLPVGLSYIAIGSKESVYVYRYKFEGNREEITARAVQYALFLAYKQLKNM